MLATQGDAYKARTVDEVTDVVFTARNRMAYELEVLSLRNLYTLIRAPFISVPPTTVGNCVFYRIGSKGRMWMHRVTAEGHDQKAHDV